MILLIDRRLRYQIYIVQSYIVPKCFQTVFLEMLECFYIFFSQNRNTSWQLVVTYVKQN